MSAPAEGRQRARQQAQRPAPPKAPMAGLAGKAALVTGGASGIGAGIARVLAAAGAAVAIGDLDGAAAAAVARRLPGAAAKLGVRLDVTDRDATHQAVTRVEQELGPVEILVNNAGISSVAPFLDISDRDWDRLMGVNLRGVLVVTQRVLPPMLAAALGPDHQHFLHGRQGGAAESGALLRDEVRRDRAHPGAGQGSRGAQRDGERGLPGGGAHAAVGRSRTPGSSANWMGKPAGRPSWPGSRSAGRSLRRTSGTRVRISHPTWP